MMPRVISVIAALALVLVIFSCSDNDTAGTLLKGTELFYANKLTDAREVLEKAHTLDPNNDEVACYLAETLRRLKMFEQSRSLAREVLARDDCNSFAQTVLAATYEPMWSDDANVSADSCWSHASAAVKCDSTDGNAWLLIWSQAMERGEIEKEEQALAALMKLDFFSKPVLEYNRWVLESLPPDAILVTSGDLDTYPAAALQQVKGIRPDVAIVNISLLNTDWYSGCLHALYHLPQPLADQSGEGVKPYKEGDEIVTAAMQRLEGWLAQEGDGKLTRPLVFAATISPNSLPKNLRDNLQLEGAYFSIGGAQSTSDELTHLKAAFDSANLGILSQSAISLQDRSPVRRVTSDFAALNLCGLGIHLCELLHENSDDVQARNYLNTVRDFAKKAGIESKFAEKFDKLDSELPG